MAALARHWKAAAVVAIGCYTTLAGLLIAYPDFSFTSDASVLAYRLARHGEAWPAIAALIGIAETFWNRDSAWRPRSEEHTSELQSLMRISYAVFCLKKKKITHHNDTSCHPYTSDRTSLSTHHIKKQQYNIKLYHN